MLQMKYSNLLLNSAGQAIVNNFAWLNLVAVLMGQITTNSSAVWFLSIVLSMIFASGLVYSISQKELYNLETPLLAGLRKGWSRIIQVSFLYILLVVALFVVFAFIGLVLHQTVSYAPRTIGLALFLRPLLIFGICAIVIDNASIGMSVRKSLSMFIRKISQIFIFSAVFVVIQQILLGIIILVIYLSPYRDLLLVSSTGSSLSYFKILELPQIIFYDQVLSLILFPWIAVTFTRLYLSFINASEYAVLSPGQKAA